MFDIYTIIFLALAVFIFLRLRSVLGQRTGRERPPYDPYSAREAARPSTNDNVVALPPRASERCGAPSLPTSSRPSAGRALRSRAPPPRSVSTPWWRKTRPSIRSDFLAGGRAAYEMIVTAYAQGDRRTLKNLLSKDVYDGFEPAIKDRESRGEKAETRFVSIDKADITGADVKGKTAQVTVRFVSQLVSVTRDKDGNVIDGSPDKVTDVTDVWTFARDLSSRDPNWKLVATEAGQ